MKNRTLLLTLALLAFAGCTTQENPKTDEFGLTIGEEEEAQAAQALKMKEVACEDSGGSFDSATDLCTMTLDSETTSTQNSGQTYEWEAQNLSFDYTEAYNVLKLDDNAVFITTASVLPEGDSSVFFSSLMLETSDKLEDRVNEYRKEGDANQSFTQSTEIFNGMEFTKVSFFNNFGGFTETHFLIELNGKLLDYKVGKDDDALAIQVLETLKFN